MISFYAILEAIADILEEGVAVVFQNQIRKFEDKRELQRLLPAGCDQNASYDTDCRIGVRIRKKVRSYKFKPKSILQCTQISVFHFIVSLRNDTMGDKKPVNLKLSISFHMSL